MDWEKELWDRFKYDMIQLGFGVMAVALFGIGVYYLLNFISYLSW